MPEVSLGFYYFELVLLESSILAFLIVFIKLKLEIRILILNELTPIKIPSLTLENMVGKRFLYSLFLPNI